MLRRLFRASCVALLVTAGSFARGQERQTLADFEQAGVAEQLEAKGGLMLTQVPVAKDAPEQGPAGLALAAKTDGGAGVYAKGGQTPKDLLNVSRLELWVHRSGEEAERGKSVVELQFLERDDKARFMHKLELDHRGWKKYDLPLKWFRDSGGRVARWDQIDRWGLWFRDEAQVQVDGLTLVRDKDPDAALLQIEDLRKVAFPENAPADVRVVDESTYILLTNAPALEAEKLGAHLAVVEKQLREDMPFLRPYARPAVLLVFRTQREFAAFPPRLAEHYQAMAPSPRSGGYTILGLATSYWDERQGTLRPVYTHEFVHSVLTRGAALANSGEWLQEGLAVHYQLLFHPQANFKEIVTTGVANANQHLPLAELTNGRPIPMNRYWQAATLCRMLLTDAKYRDKFEKLLAAMAESGSTELAPHLEKVLGTSWEELTADWKRFCAKL